MVSFPVAFNSVTPIKHQVQGGLNEIYFKKIRLNWNNHLNGEDSEVNEMFCSPPKKGGRVIQEDVKSINA